MNRKRIAVIAGGLAAALLFLGAPARAFDIPASTMFNDSLEGWSADGKLVAYQHIAGVLDMAKPENEWQVSYMVVADARTGKVVDRYKVSATRSTERLAPREWALYSRAKPSEDWYAIKREREFERPDAALSSNGWIVAPKLLNGKNAVLRSSEGIADGGPQQIGRKISGKVLHYTIDDPHWRENWGKWMLSFALARGEKTVSFGAPVLSTGNPQGYLATYWAPDGRSAAMEWVHSPEGLGERVDLFTVALPK
jgi:hypothetical protein